ncbi:MAG TPA: hypothetical protein H9722_00430 [Candidatus Mediterraneibacter pullistercoris]|nr:hypothetical protein [Candidatus Mediterraneibacter pullistercoris]
MKKWKVLLSSMALCVCTISPFTSHAAASPSEISQALQNSEAYMQSADGERIDLDITEVEVKQIPVPSEYRTRSNFSDIVAYKATAKTKTGTSSYKKNGINAASSLTMTWVDGEGAKNKITKLTGYFTVAKGKFSKGKVYWGSTYTGPTFAPHSRNVGTNFNLSVSYTSNDKVAGKLRADSIGFIVSPTNGKTYQMTLRVSPTIFD